MRERWAALSYYQRFESAAALVLTVLIATVVVVALYRLTASVIAGLLGGLLDPLDQNVFRAVFGEIITVLIAIEFNHTLLHVVARRESIIQTRVVLLIALLALARKLVVFDLQELSAAQLAGLAAVTLAVAAAYWLIRERAAGRSAANGEESSRSPS